MDHRITGHVDDWPVIVIPEWPHLDPALIEELVQYANRGGSLLIIGAKTASLFREHLGVEFDGEPTERTLHVQIDPRLAPGAEPAAVPLKGLWQTINITGASKPLAWHTTDRMGTAGRSVAATMTACGKGKVAAVYGPLAAGYGQDHAPGMRDFIHAVLRRLYRPMVSIDFAEVPHCLDLAVRRKDGRLVVHLVNVAQMTTADARYVLIDDIPPVGPVKLRIRLSGKPKRTTLQPEGKQLRGQWSKGELTLTIPRVAIHTAVVIE